MGLRCWVAHVAIFIIALFVAVVFSALLREFVSLELLSFVKDVLFALLIVGLLAATGFLEKLK